jgi:hypothetical protein
MPPGVALSHSVLHSVTVYTAVVQRIDSIYAKPGPAVVNMLTGGGDAKRAGHAGGRLCLEQLLTVQSHN